VEEGQLKDARIWTNFNTPLLEANAVNSQIALSTRYSHYANGAPNNDTYGVIPPALRPKFSVFLTGMRMVSRASADFGFVEYSSFSLRRRLVR